MYTALYEIDLSEVKRYLKHCEVKVALPLHWLYWKVEKLQVHLGESLQYISRHYDWERQLRQKVMSAISYPIFLLLMMNVFFLVTILFIIPSFEKVFTTMHITLPLMTRALFALGQGLKNHPILVFIMHCVVLGGYGLLHIINIV